VSEPCILIVESDILVRGPLAEYLRECGYRVIEAADAGEARTFCADGKNRIDVILADVDTPGENGFALAAWVRSHHPEIDVVLAGTVARAADKAGELCNEGPALKKPYEHQFVLDRIRRLIAARERKKS
jgi:DNA-binding response OmpR family regulator